MKYVMHYSKSQNCYTVFPHDHGPELLFNDAEFITEIHAENADDMKAQRAVFIQKHKQEQG